MASHFPPAIPHSALVRNWHIRSSPVTVCASIFLDEAHMLPVARNLAEAIFCKHIGCVFCSVRGLVCASSLYHPVSLVVLCVFVRILWGSLIRRRLHAYKQ